MENNKKILIKFTLYFLVLLLIIIIGVSNVFALSNYNQIQFYDNYGSSVTWKTTNWIQQTQESYAEFGLTANSTGGLLVYTLSTPVVNKHIYSMFVNVGTRNYGGYTTLSTKNCIGLGNSLAQATNDYISCTLTPRYSNNSTSTGEYNKGLFFTFVANKNASYIAIPFTSQQSTGGSVPIYSYGLEMEDNGDSTNMTEQQVSSIVDTQTDSIENTLANIENNIGTNILNSQQAIINNQNENTQQQIESQQVCKSISKNNIKTDGYLQTNGVIENNDWAKDNFGITDYLITKNSTFRAINIYNNSSSAFCFYDNDYNLLSCRANNTMTENGLISIPTNANYVRFSIYKRDDIPRVTYCGNGNQAVNDSINNLNDSINDDDTGSANNDTASFITGFNTNTFGLTSIITAPLNLIQSLTSTTCTPLHLPLPYMNNKYLDLPCMSTIYSQHFGTFFTLYQTITYGIISYWVCVRIFNHVKDFKNPEHDEIEVVDL